MNNLKKDSSKKGFTIIEVVLVLAIAGLIFLMVFIALPALQRNQRDTQRKNDMGRLSSQLVNYTSSNRGSLPPASIEGYAAFVGQYLVAGGDSFIDPSGAGPEQTGSPSTYVMAYTPAVGTILPTDFAVTQNIIYVTPGAVCGESSSTVKAGGSRTVAFRMVLESGGVSCVNN